MKTKRSRSPRPGRSLAEWVTFAVSCCVLAVVVGAIVFQLFSDADPAAPFAERGAVTRVDDRFFVVLEVINEGDDSAAEVHVSAELTIDGVTTTVDQVVDFLAGGESQRLTAVFDEDPSAGELVLAVRGFRQP